MRYLFNPFAGEIGRKHWWLLQFAAWGIFFVVLFVMVSVDIAMTSVETAEGSNHVGKIVFLACILLYMNFASSLNRLRDSGRSRWLYLAFLLPNIGTVLMIYLCGIEKGEAHSKSVDYAEVFGGDEADERMSRRTANLLGSGQRRPVMAANTRATNVRPVSVRPVSGSMRGSGGKLFGGTHPARS